jgi:FixJ family two-component response regulator
MSKEKQILQLLQKGYSQRRIADTLKVSRNTVAKVTKAVMEHPIPVDILDSISESELCQKLFPEEALIPVHVTSEVSSTSYDGVFIRGSIVSFVGFGHF